MLSTRLPEDHQDATLMWGFDETTVPIVTSTTSTLLQTHCRHLRSLFVHFLDSYIAIPVMDRATLLKMASTADREKDSKLREHRSDIKVYFDNRGSSIKHQPDY